MQNRSEILSAHHEESASAEQNTDRKSLHPVFLLQLIKMMEDDKNKDIIEWADGCIQIHNPERLEKELLLRYFRHSKLTSFQRQLNYFGFHKDTGFGKHCPCTYVNDVTTSDIKSLLTIKRRKVAKPGTAAATGRRAEDHAASSAAASAASSAAASIHHSSRMGTGMIDAMHGMHLPGLHQTALRGMPLSPGTLDHAIREKLLQLQPTSILNRTLHERIVQFRQPTNMFSHALRSEQLRLQQQEQQLRLQQQEQQQQMQMQQLLLREENQQLRLQQQAQQQQFQQHLLHQHEEALHSLAVQRHHHSMGSLARMNSNLGVAPSLAQLQGLPSGLSTRARFPPPQDDERHKRGGNNNF